MKFLWGVVWTVTMPLQDKGVYTIRYVPRGIKLPFAGGMYATSKDYGGPLYGESNNPTSVTGTQDWQLFAVAGKENTYRISAPQWPESALRIIQGPGPVLPGWGLPGDVPTGRNDLVLFKVQEVEWLIEAADQESTYTISPAHTDGRIGVGFAVDLNHHNETLYVRTFPVIRDPPPRPTWQFEQCR
ncbi:hypothetical protein BJ165DRAFT_417712 [Panaeolus papilionaceus]|nr:hypothetical protein BJ165DRAFT_417712 [Panaeolus papilionaceus]